MGSRRRWRQSITVVVVESGILEAEFAELWTAKEELSSATHLLHASLLAALVLEPHL